MNDKLKNVIRLTRIALSCSSTDATENDVVGNSRTEELVRIRCLLISVLVANGYTVTFIAKYLNRTKQAIRYLMKLALKYSKHNNSYRLTETEILRLSKETS